MTSKGLEEVGRTVWSQYRRLNPQYGFRAEGSDSQRSPDLDGLNELISDLAQGKVYLERSRLGDVASASEREDVAALLDRAGLGADVARELLDGMGDVDGDGADLGHPLPRDTGAVMGPERISNNQSLSDGAEEVPPSNEAGLEREDGEGLDSDQLQRLARGYAVEIESLELQLQECQALITSRDEEVARKDELLAAAEKRVEALRGRLREGDRRALGPAAEELEDAMLPEPFASAETLQDLVRLNQHERIHASFEEALDREAPRGMLRSMLEAYLEALPYAQLPPPKSRASLPGAPPEEQQLTHERKKEVVRWLNQTCKLLGFRFKMAEGVVGTLRVARSTIQVRATDGGVGTSTVGPSFSPQLRIVNPRKALGDRA
ncbi:MAG: hypothetical protein AAFY15_00020 [Cyanobacteria bacterium J06648_11]